MEISNSNTTTRLNPDEVNWNEPQSYLGTIGYWKSNKDGEITWEPRCNFDFVIERELSSAAGGGFVLQVKPEWGQQQYRAILTSEDAASPDKFTAAIAKANGRYAIVSLTKCELNALMAAKLAAYHRTRNGQIFHSIDRYGQQDNGLWVFENIQFTPKGQQTEENESLTIFNPILDAEEYISCPILAAPNGIDGLKALIEAAIIVFGSDNIHQFLLCCGWVVAGLKFQSILKQERRFPLLNAYGAVGSTKNVALQAALSLVGINWSDDGIISKVTLKAVNEHLSKTGSLPVIWDAPLTGENSRELDEFSNCAYNAKPRMVRGNLQKQHSPIGLSSDRVIGSDRDATFTRFARIPFYPGGNTNAIPMLKEAMEQASGSFPVLINIGYNRQKINAIQSEFLALLPLAHERIAWNLAVVVYYAEKLIELVGREENPRKWALDNLTPIENHSDQLGNFIRCIIALENKNLIGSWDKRIFTDEQGVKWVAIYPASVWSEVQKVYKATTFNQKSLKMQLLKVGGKVDKSVRFYASRDEFWAYNGETLTAGKDKEGNPIKPKPPQKKMKKAWLIPFEMFGINADIDPDTDLPNNLSDKGFGDEPESLGGETVETVETVVKPISVSFTDELAIAQSSLNTETAETTETVLTQIPVLLTDELAIARSADAVSTCAQPLPDSETAETVMKPNSISLSNAFPAKVSGLQLPTGNQGTVKINVKQDNNLHIATSSESSQELVFTALERVSSVSPAKTTQEQQLQPETPVVSGQFHPVSQSSTNSALTQKAIIENTPRAVTLRRPDGRLIHLPAEYPGATGKNQMNEPHQIAKLLWNIQSKEDWEAIETRYGEMRSLWVWRWHFNQAQRTALANLISGKCKQLALF